MRHTANSDGYADAASAAAVAAYQDKTGCSCCRTAASCLDPWALVPTLQSAAAVRVRHCSCCCDLSCCAHALPPLVLLPCGHLPLLLTLGCCGQLLLPEFLPARPGSAPAAPPAALRQGSAAPPASQVTRNMCFTRNTHQFDKSGAIKAAELGSAAS